MATIDEILNNKPAQAQPARQQPATLQATQPNKVNVSAPAMPEPPAPQRMTYTEMFQKMNPYTPPTPEELAKEKKRQKSEAIISAIGDGITALSNLAFTAKGAPYAAPTGPTLSVASRKRWDKLKAEREANNKEYMHGYMRAQEMDRAQEDRDRDWRYRLGRDAEQDRRYQEGLADRAEEKAYRREQDRKAEEWKQKAFEADEKQRAIGNAHAGARIAEEKRYHDMVDSERKAQKKESKAKALRGNQLGFTDGEGKQVGIWENVWKVSYPQIFNTLVKELRPTDEYNAGKWDRQMNNLTAAQQEIFVKNNWTLSESATAQMNELGKIDPAQMESTIDDDEFAEFVEDDGKKTDFSKYKNKK